MSTESTPEPAEPDGTSARIESADVRIRRAPKIPVFLVLGGVVGAVVTLIVTALFPADPSVGFAALYGYFVLYGIPIGVVLGAIVAFGFDRASERRAANVTAELTTVDPLPEAVLPEDVLPEEAVPDDDAGEPEGEANGATGR
ncbi:hypothetical protein BH09ACT1_BH09ACT1_00420 [soil metagenome]